MAPSRRPSSTASRRGACAWARPDRPVAAASVASAWRQRASATSYGASSAAHPCATCRQIVPLSSPSSRRWKARAVASDASATPARAGRRRGARCPDQPARLLDHLARALAGGGQRRELAVLARLDRRGGIDLGDHRGHPRGEQPLLRGPHGRPAPIDRAAGIGDVAAPQRERGGGDVVRAGQLRLADGVELEDRLAEQPRGVLAGVHLDLDDRELEDAGQVDDADRQPAHRPFADRARLGPAAQQEERVGDVARQEVAVDGLETGAPGVLDALVGDVDRFGPPADEVEHGRQVGPDAEERIGIVELTRRASQPRAAARSRRSGPCPRRARPRGSSWRGPPGRGRPDRRRARP